MSRVYTIDDDNDIVLFASEEDANANTSPGAMMFTSQVGLEALAKQWSPERTLEVFNSLPGTIPTKKFESRKLAVKRIWSAIQGLRLPEEANEKREAVEQPAVEVKEELPVKTANGKKKKQKAKAAPKPRKERKAKATANGKPKVEREAGVPREGSKAEAVLALLKRKGGATLDELVKATKWTANSVYGFLSGTIGKKMGLTLLSEKDPETKARTYKLAA